MIAFVLVSALPLLWPAIPPITDLPGHLGSYKVELDLRTSPFLARYFDFRWAPVGNLGADLLIIPFSKLFGVELGAKLIVMAIPPLTVVGMIFVAHEVHGRMPPSALFALPLAYGYPFQFGFVNFTLAIALMFLSIGLWLRLRRLDRTRLRTVLFVPIGFVLFITHSMGWAMFGLIVFGIEAMAFRDDGAAWSKALWQAAIACLPLAPPILLMADWLLYRSAGATNDPSGWSGKYYYALAILRNDSYPFDLSSARLLYVLLIGGIWRMGLRLDPRLGAGALLLTVAYLLMPGVMMGAAYADMRMAAYIVALAILALGPRHGDRKWDHVLAIAGLAFFVARMGTQAWTYYRLDRGYQAQLAAIDHIPYGARIFAMANIPCPDDWNQPRIDHLGAIAIVRRDAFVNGQWPMPGGRLLSVRYAPAAGFALDPTQFLEPESCRKSESYSLDQVVGHLPHDAFDYLWLIGLPPDRWPHEPGLVPVWHADRGILYRIIPSAGAT